MKGWRSKELMSRKVKIRKARMKQAVVREENKSRRIRNGCRWVSKMSPKKAQSILLEFRCLGGKRTQT